MIATGAISVIASGVEHRRARSCGAPNHAAFATGAKSIGLPRPRPLASDRVDHVGDHEAEQDQQALQAAAREHRDAADADDR